MKLSMFSLSLFSFKFNDNILFIFSSSTVDVLLIFVLKVKVPLKLFEFSIEFFIDLSPNINNSYKAERLYILIFDAPKIFLINLDLSFDISSKIGTIKFLIIT